MMCSVLLLFFFFFFKQKTAYEMRISDWSSDVCSSDLTRLGQHGSNVRLMRTVEDRRCDGQAALGLLGKAHERLVIEHRDLVVGLAFVSLGQQIGRASCRERVCQYV